METKVTEPEEERIMNPEEKSNGVVELNEENLEKTAGGSIIGCLFGSHDLDMIDSYPVTANGSRHFYIKKKCNICGKLIYERRNSATGCVESISESQYNSMKSSGDVF